VRVEAGVAISGRLRAYLEAWDGLNPQAIGALYGAQATHRGPFVAAFAPESSDATLVGPTAVAAYAAAIRDQFGEGTSESVVTAAYEDGATSVVEHELRPGGIKMAEIITWDGSKVARVHGYAHMPAN